MAAAAAVALLPVGYHVININKQSAEFSAFSLKVGYLDPALMGQHPTLLLLMWHCFLYLHPQSYHWVLSRFAQLWSSFEPEKEVQKMP